MLAQCDAAIVAASRRALPGVGADGARDGDRVDALGCGVESSGGLPSTAWSRMQRGVPTAGPTALRGDQDLLDHAVLPDLDVDVGLLGLDAATT